MPARYVILDVFTSTPLQGNPLAAVIDSEGFSTERMQRVANEFNLSETIFIEPPQDPANRARIRIFTRTLELPFAGHPTVGAAALLAYLDDDAAPGQELSFALEEIVGVLPCRARRLSEYQMHARFQLAHLPEISEPHGGREAIAAALSLTASDIGFDNHAPVDMTAGTPFTAVPVSDLAAIARVEPRPELWTSAFGGGSHAAAFIYTKGGREADASYHARVFAPNGGIREDPATGSAAAAFIGAMHHFEGVTEGAHRRVIEQGFEMGRPSRIVAEFSVESGRISRAHIGGDVAVVARGELL